MVGRARWKVGAGGSSARNIVAGGKPVRAPEWTACRAQELAHGFQPGPVEKKGEGEKGPAARKRVMVEGERSWKGEVDKLGTAQPMIM
jgi:hypothetical protein